MKITKEGIAVLDDDRDGLLSRWVERDGRLDHDESLPNHYLRHIKAGDAVIDVGAAIGDHTIAYIRATGDPKLVHAFEPNPLMVACLMHNCPDCQIHPVGLSDKPESALLWHSDLNAGAGYIGQCSVEHAEKFTVALVALDSFNLTKVDFIKMDIEGMECRAVKGAVETLRRCKPKMILEVNPSMLKRAGSSAQELFETLSAIGYKFQIEIGNCPTIEDPESRADFFCCPA